MYDVKHKVQLQSNKNSISHSDYLKDSWKKEGKIPFWKKLRFYLLLSFFIYIIFLSLASLTTILFSPTQLPSPPKKIEFLPGCKFSISNQRDHGKRMVCQVFKSSACQSLYIADSIDLFWVISPVYRFDVKSDQMYRQKHVDFKSYIESIGLKFITIEAIRSPQLLKEREGKTREATEYTLTKPNKEPYDMQVYYYNVSYIRENLLNVALKKLDKLAHWEYVAWIDGHQIFENAYWWEETIYKSEKFGDVQLFEKLVMLDAINNTAAKFNAIIRASLFESDIDSIRTVFGNAHTITRSTYNGLGSIYDECIATSCDCAFVLATFPTGVGWKLWAPKYYQNFQEWINHAKKVFKGSRTYIKGRLYHLYHGKSFPYLELQEAVERLGFNASRDIGRYEDFTLYIKNEEVANELERIVLASKLVK